MSHTQACDNSVLLCYTCLHAKVVEHQVRLGGTFGNATTRARGHTSMATHGRRQSKRIAVPRPFIETGHVLHPVIHRALKLTSCNIPSQWRFSIRSNPSDRLFCTSLLRLSAC